MSRVTVITPTLPRRHDKLMAACASVQAQTFTDWDHLVIPNGPDPEVVDFIYAGVRVIPLGRPHPRAGDWNRVLGGLLCQTPLIAYLDDDNTWRPQHLELLVAALDAHPEAGFAYSKMLAPAGEMFDGDLAIGSVTGQIDTSVIVHRVELLSEVATWTADMARTVHPDDPFSTDAALVDLWLRNGVQYAFVPEVTVDYPQPGYRIDGGGA